MSGATVITFTGNPTIDLSSQAEEIRPTRKIRTCGESMHPGGGGINVARVLHRFGVAVEAVFLAGGVTGRVLDDLMAKAGVRRRWLEVAGDTRLSLTVHERSTGQEYRFVPEGPCVDAGECEDFVRAVEASHADYLVFSGSLPRCAPDDLYARMAKAATAGSCRLVLDSSGEDLRQALAAGGWFLVKPSRSEIEALSGRPLPSLGDVAAEAARWVTSGRVDMLAVTLGRDGAILASADGTFHLPAVPVETRSAVGAGDSFLAGMMYGLTNGASAHEAFRLGVAAGAVTSRTPGADLCHLAEVEELLPCVGEPCPI